MVRLGLGSGAFEQLALLVVMRRICALQLRVARRWRRCLGLWRLLRIRLLCTCGCRRRLRGLGVRVRGMLSGARLGGGGLLHVLCVLRLVLLLSLCSLCGLDALEEAMSQPAQSTIVPRAQRTGWA